MDLSNIYLHWTDGNYKTNNNSLHSIGHVG